MSSEWCTVCGVQCAGCVLYNVFCPVHGAYSVQVLNSVWYTVCSICGMQCVLCSMIHRDALWSVQCAFGGMWFAVYGVWSQVNDMPHAVFSLKYTIHSVCSVQWVFWKMVLGAMFICVYIFCEYICKYMWLNMNIDLYIHVYACIYVQVHIVHVCGGQRSILAIFLHCSPCYALNDGFSLVWSSPKLAYQ